MNKTTKFELACKRHGLIAMSFVFEEEEGERAWHGAIPVKHDLDFEYAVKVLRPYAPVPAILTIDKETGNINEEGPAFVVYEKDSTYHDLLDHLDMFHYEVAFRMMRGDLGFDFDDRKHELKCFMLSKKSIL